ncbi:hypothetical protein CANARDRAFT_6927 [[Candida] arabinofermentans NRRL YB-2248]|uniref:4a-hydroxytetrahydrobiopterin dehydratase n=1 Tax=[Candida] arabinofermentans NRRL YB-2248 TaxID=983967 RepID=A0A1E4T3W8_9ASCO|nr:hypothetical protein CANARDRAFT_6927 [[Candida] arabinofermentans NRRL YB-2248]
MSKIKYIKLSLTEISNSLKKLPVDYTQSQPWRLSVKSDIQPSVDKLTRQFTFKTFEDTWAFLTKVSMRSHLSGHHPKITTVYNSVEIELTTHDVEGLTELDFQLAKRFTNYANQIGEKPKM